MSKSIKHQLMQSEAKYIADNGLDGVGALAVSWIRTLTAVLVFALFNGKSLLSQLLTHSHCPEWKIV